MTEQEQEYRQEFRSYGRGLVLALLLTAVPFALVAWAEMQRAVLLWTIAGLALLQIVVHMRCFLHLGLSGRKREDLQLILFTVLLLAIMGGGTIWIMFDLYDRMMPPA